MYLWRKCILLCLIYFIAGLTKAQVQHQIGFNASQFVKQFVVPNSTALISNNPYLLQYRMLRKKINYRAGLGGNYSFENQNNQSSQFIQNTDDRTIAARLGFDFVKAITKHWFVYYGVDAFTSQNRNIIEIKPTSGITFLSNSKVTRKSYAYGGALNFTIEYRINNKITVFTEANLNLLRGRTYEKVENRDFPDSNSENKTRFGRSTFNSPINLSFSIFI